MKINLVKENYFRKEDGTFDRESALLFGGRAAGICYDKQGYDHLLDEPIEKTQKRTESTLNNTHHSVHGHCDVVLYIENIPKILAMVLNNEHEYNTSEKSARYTPIERVITDPVLTVTPGNISGNSITELEEKLYNKWMNIFTSEISKKYSNVFNESKIKKLAQENSRYLVTVFMDTKMMYKTSFRQINYLASFMKRYINEHDSNNEFQNRLSLSMQEFIDELNRLNILDERLMKNEKNRRLSLFSERFDDKREVFSDIYLTKYKGSFAELAQAQRHRTINYEMRVPSEYEFFIPPIIADNEELKKEWLNDCNRVKNVYPQGLLIDICENGTYENFILKCKERLCSAAQLEIMQQTRKTLLEYKKHLEEDNHPLIDDIAKYANGARCTFPDYKCPSPCGFKEGINLTRKI